MVAKIAKAIVKESRWFLVGIGFWVLLIVFAIQPDHSLRYWLTFSGTVLLLYVLFCSVQVLWQEHRSREQRG